MPEINQGCPRCGWNSGMGKGMKVIIGLGAVVVAIFVIGAVGGESSTGSSSSSGASSSAPEAQPAREEIKAPTESPPIDVTARVLFKAYDANEVSADDTYKGKKIRVSGTVSSIDKDMFDHIIVRLSGGDSFGINTVDATVLPSQKGAAAQLSKKQAVTLLCTGNGKVMDPQLDDCSFAR
jgi:hypothetical protein